ncbi:MAG: ParA family protein [Oscillospiraceae bacterium]|jgi:chromosome partitioning protein|nr:ParA family protein [Oscillospiraceae bacterium]
MAKTIALFNQQGGVGKTTTAVNLTAALTLTGRRVLLVDVDPQGHSTSGLGVDKDAAAFSSYNVLLEGVPVSRAIVKTKYGSVIPANKGLFGAGIQLTSFEKREHVLRSALLEVQNDFDVIFIDCPALLELLTLNALVAADSLIIPVQCEYLALEGIADLMTSIKMLQRGLNPALEIEGILLTMFDARTNLSTQVASEVKKHFKSKVFKTAIPRNVRLSEAPSHGKPVTAYDPASKGSTAYMELAKEINGRVR